VVFFNFLSKLKTAIFWDVAVLHIEINIEIAVGIVKYGSIEFYIVGRYNIKIYKMQNH